MKSGGWFRQIQKRVLYLAKIWTNAFSKWTECQPGTRPTGACWQWANDASSSWILRILIFAHTTGLEFSVNVHHFGSLILFFVPKSLFLAHGILPISKPLPSGDRLREVAKNSHRRKKWRPQFWVKLESWKSVELHSQKAPFISCVRDSCATKIMSFNYPTIVEAPGKSQSLMQTCTDASKTRSTQLTQREKNSAHCWKTFQLFKDRQIISAHIANSQLTFW